MTYIWDNAGSTVQVLNPQTVGIASDMGNPDGDWGVIVGEDMGGNASIIYGDPESLIDYFRRAADMVAEAVAEADEEEVEDNDPLTDEEREELAELRIVFEAQGGRGVDIAERIDALAARE